MMRGSVLGGKGRRVLVAVFLLALAIGLSGEAMAAKKPPASKKKAKTQAIGEPIDVSSPLQPCYRLSSGKLGHRCEPQSLPYGRCRTGNMTCRGNYELSPIGWYKCAERNGHVTGTPTANSIFILGDNSKHRINTGHVFVVEKVKDHGGGRWELTLSHTNHDRRCSLETNVSASYDEKKKLLTMNTGQWSRWGKNLSALGFILKDGRVASREAGK